MIKRAVRILKENLKKVVKKESKEYRSIDTKEGKIYFGCPSDQAKWRVETLKTKEKMTIDWIKEFQKEDVVWDIGANIGIYSIFSALFADRVISFEPSFSNFNRLYKNVIKNKMSNKVSAYCIGVDKKCESSNISMSSTRAGAALHNYGRDKKGSKGFDQSVISLSIDFMVEKLQIEKPTHVKIDVDGFEHEVVSGAEKTLRKEVVKSAIIEIDTNSEKHLECVKKMEELGFSVEGKEECKLEGEYNFLFRKSN